MPILPSYIFIILIALVSGYLTFLTTKGNLTDNRRSNLWNRLTKRGKLVVYILSMFVIILIAQECNNQNSNKANSLQLVKERNYRDSIVSVGIRKGVDSSSNKLFKNLSKAFAEQNLRIDTLKNTVIKLKDSVKTTINNYSQEDPVLIIKSKDIILKSKQSNSSECFITFTSIDAGSGNYDVKTYILVEYIDGAYGFINTNMLEGIKFSKNGSWKTGFNTNSKIEVKNIYVHIIGKYSTLDRTKKYNIDDIYMYEKSSDITTTALEPIRSKIISIIKSKQLSITGVKSNR